MLRIGKFALSEPPSASVKGSPGSSNAEATAVQPPDEVQLSKLTDIVLQNRSERIAELRTIAASPGYSVPAVSVSQKLIAGALSRPD
jgi:hypothetical protein